MKHVQWVASHPDALPCIPCTFCNHMARYHVGIVHGMHDATYLSACGDVRCVVRLYLLYVSCTRLDLRMCLVALLSDITTVCDELLHVEGDVIEDVQYRVGADYRPLEMLIEQIKSLDEKRDSYVRLEKAEMRKAA